jgi:transcriptional regulator with XRE-family HTH domain
MAENLNKSIDEVRIEFGKALRNWRNLNSMSIDQASQKLYLSEQQLGRIERGQSVIHYPKLSDIQKTYHIADAHKEIQPQLYSTIEEALEFLTRNLGHSEKSNSKDDIRDIIDRTLKEILNSDSIRLPKDPSCQLTEVFNEIRSVFYSYFKIEAEKRLEIFKGIAFQNIHSLSNELARMGQGTLSYVPRQNHMDVFNAWSRILDYCSSGSVAIATSIAPPEWWTTYNHYVDLNAEKIHKGVRIIRVFIHGSNYIENNGTSQLKPKEPLTAVLERQHEAGIEVYLMNAEDLTYIKPRDLLIGNVLVDAKEVATIRSIQKMEGNSWSVVGEQRNPTKNGFEELTTSTSIDTVTDAIDYLNICLRKSVRFLPNK